MFVVGVCDDVEMFKLYVMLVKVYNVLISVEVIFGVLLDILWLEGGGSEVEIMFVLLDVLLK